MQVEAEDDGRGVGADGHGRHVQTRRGAGENGGNMIDLERCGTGSRTYVTSGSRVDVPRDASTGKQERLNKCDIGTSKVAVKNMTITMISFMSCGITREDTLSRTGIKFIITKILIMNIVNKIKNLKW